jgi:hypothetical protein
LGATTLERLGLVLNPFQRQLHPMKLVLMRMSPKKAPDVYPVRG